jgi:hypothetical protein
MATEKFTGAQTDAGLSDADLRGKELRFCKRTATGVDLAGAGDLVAGVISEGKAAGLHTSFKTGNILKVLAGEAIAVGDQIGSGANGLARTAVSGDDLCGTAISAASEAGVVFDMQFDQMGIKP